MKKNKIVAAALIGLICFLSVEATKQFILPKMNAPLDKRALRRSQGKPSNPVWVVEYFDFQCGNCRFSAREMKKYLSDYPSKIFLQLRFFPLQGHPHGFRSALYAECATEQDKFWDFYDLVFDKQPEWTGLSSVDEVFREYARSVRIDVRRLEACVEDPKTERTVNEEREKAKALGVNATPAFFIGGDLFIGSQKAFEALEKELKK